MNDSASAQLFDQHGLISTPCSLRVNTLNHANETIQFAVGALIVCGVEERRTHM